MAVYAYTNSNYQLYVVGMINSNFSNDNIWEERLEMDGGKEG